MRSGKATADLILFQTACSRYLVHLLVLIALLAVTFIDAFPHGPLPSDDSDFAANVVPLPMARRDDFDPYGFNSILSRFHKRSKPLGMQPFDENYSLHELYAI